MIFTAAAVVTIANMTTPTTIRLVLRGGMKAVAAIT